MYHVLWWIGTVHGIRILIELIRLLFHVSEMLDMDKRKGSKPT